MTVSQSRSAKEFVNDGTIDPYSWVKKSEIDEEQAAISLDYAMKSIAKTKVFMTASVLKQSHFTPRQIIDTWARALECTQDEFIKATQLYKKTSTKTK